MAFFELYADSANGDNRNTGDGLTPVESTNGDWGNAAANRFTAASGTPFSGASVGQLAAVFLDGASSAVYISAITAVNGGGASIDLSTTRKIGTAPTTGASGRTCRVGGVIAGVHGSAVATLMTGIVTWYNISDADLKPVRLNLKNNATYLPTVLAWTLPSGIVIEGYATTPGDGGKAFIDFGSTSFSAGGAIGVSLPDSRLRHVRLKSSSVAWSSSSRVVSAAGTYNGQADHCAVILDTADVDAIGFYGNVGIGETALFNCLVESLQGTRQYGIGYTGGCKLYDCTACNLNHGADTHILNYGQWNRCRFIKCTIGIRFGQGGGSFVDSSDFYDCTTAVQHFYATSTQVTILNCNFVKNGTVFNPATIGGLFGQSPYLVINCGFTTSGGNANTTKIASGRNDCVVEEGSIDYGSSMPWTDPANGDFTINLAAAKNAGYQSLYLPWTLSAQPVGYPDIGSIAAQAASGGLIRHPGMGGGING